MLTRRNCLNINKTVIAPTPISPYIVLKTTPTCSLQYFRCLNIMKCDHQFFVVSGQFWTSDQAGENRQKRPTRRGVVKEDSYMGMISHSSIMIMEYVWEEFPVIFMMAKYFEFYYFVTDVDVCKCPHEINVAWSLSLDVFDIV